ncbi:hypothetical protein [Candidatus Parabeggiatoa sp. HSG14]|uniref:helix-turn-helix domain-containing protein n=1 Tax=Candidatus Parabeggiatoa sp. HSG14 TaxID=3055593 RepID=UPI0025A8ABE7|nr:hypothetical protein [Thiotrichales bacterium HSG14]
MGKSREVKDSRKLGIWYSEDEFFDYGVTKHIGASAAVVYFALCRHADRDGKSYPSVKLLMDECDLSNRLIAKSTRILKDVFLLDFERCKHQHNIYYVKAVKDAIALNGWKKIVRDKESFIGKQVVNTYKARDKKSFEQVTKSHEARDEKSLEQVTKSHEARDEKSHKGDHNKGDHNEGDHNKGFIKNTHTDIHRSENSKNSAKKSVCVLPLNDFEKSAWDWSQNHEFWKGRITSHEQLRTNLAKAGAFRTQFEQINTPVQPVTSNSQAHKTSKPSRPRKKIAVKDCPYCDNRGLLHLVDEQGGRFDNRICTHDENEIKALVNEKGFSIKDAKSGEKISPIPRNSGLNSMSKILDEVKRRQAAQSI